MTKTHTPIGTDIETFRSLYRGSMRMRVAGAEDHLKSSEEIFRRMLVVWYADNDIPLDERYLSEDDWLAYHAHVRPAKSSTA